MGLLIFFNEFPVSKRCRRLQNYAVWRSQELKKIKRIGPNIDRWGALILISLSEDLVLLIVVCCILTSSNDLSHFFDLSRIP